MHLLATHAPNWNKLKGYPPLASLCMHLLATRIPQLPATNNSSCISFPNCRGMQRTCTLYVCLHTYQHSLHASYPSTHSLWFRKLGNVEVPLLVLILNYNNIIAPAVVISPNLILLISQYTPTVGVHCGILVHEVHGHVPVKYTNCSNDTDQA